MNIYNVLLSARKLGTVYFLEAGNSIFSIIMPITVLTEKDGTRRKGKFAFSNVAIGVSVQVCSL